ncbi:site-specific integrase [Chitinophaga polysaccharea]|uniref:site-specific integrase n=1 Tax=Chitinophaga polysaccharea TaxID=1293035 RepID=UPI001159C128|nr:site-specific integrase [Chitinophaga polysaccharea]
MININFNLRKQDSKSPQVIYLVLRWHGEYYRYTTRFSIAPKNWDIEKQRVRNVITELHKDTINKYLNDLENAAKGIYANAIAKQIPVTKEYLKSVLDRYTGRVVDEKKTFWSFLDKFIADAPTRTNPQTGQIISTRTIQKYNTTKDVLVEFEKTMPRKLDFEFLDLDTLNDFRDYLTQVKRHGANTVAKHIETLKGFLNEAAAVGIPVNSSYKSKHFKAKREDSAAIYLSETELQLIADLDLSTNARLDRVRDLFLIAAFTGLRYSDFTELKEHHIKKDTIELFQIKTGDPVIIPLHPKVRELLKKYDGKPAPTISNQKFNEYLKEVCEAAKLTEMVEIQKTKAGKRVKEVFEKWKLVSSHTARRSLASNLYKRGVPMQTIMIITGHKTEKAFRQYIRLGKTEHAEIVRSVWEDTRA